VEHKHWTTVASGTLDGVAIGDIVRVTRRDPLPAYVTVMRKAADELASPE